MELPNNVNRNALMYIYANNDTCRRERIVDGSAYVDTAGRMSTHCGAHELHHQHHTGDVEYAYIRPQESGEIDLPELKAAMQSLGYESKNETIFTMLSELDKDGNATLSFDEFLELMSGKEGQGPDGGDGASRDEINKIFKLFDSEGNNVITPKDVHRVAKELGERLSNEEVAEIVRRACSDESMLEITPEDFYVVMTKKTFP